MNMRDIDVDAIYAERIRALRKQHSKAHAALLNWQAWGLDRRGIGPRDSKPHIWQEAATSKFDDFGEDHAIPAERLAQTDVKAEYDEPEPYDAKAAEILDERINSPMLAEYLKQFLKAVYAKKAVPDYQLPRVAGCPPHAVVERLEEALRFVSRFS